MFYILTKPGEEPVYPYTLTDLMRANPNVSWPRDMTNFDASDWHCYPVQDTTPPEAPNMVAVRAMPSLVDGVWHEQWVLEPAPPVPVPQSVTMAQARLALLYANLLQQVDAAIDAIPDAIQREAARVQWEYETVVSRSSDLVTGLGAALGLTDEQIDNLFRTAATL
jgi:hypothetical protein